MLDTMRLLLNQKALIDATDVYGKSVLQYMLRQRVERDKIMQILIAEGASLYSENQNAESILHTAFAHAPFSTLQVLREQGLDLNIQDHLILTPLFKVLSCESPVIRSEERAVALVRGAPMSMHVIRTR